MVQPAPGSERVPDGSGGQARRAPQDSLRVIVGAIVAARRVAKVPTIRLVSTKQPPELSIVMGLTWHLFNSHIW